MKNPGLLVFMVVLVVALGMLVSQTLKTNERLTQQGWKDRRGDETVRWNESLSVNHIKRFSHILTDNVEEQSDRYVVTVNTLGAQMSAIDVDLEGRLLKIVLKISQAKKESDPAHGQYSYRERYEGEYSRVLTLPGPVNENKMRTEYDNGVLTITIPKR
ncbi:MAG: Hsp20/alpha crystallin family protein [Gammaproteobacteria bacterium]